MIKKLVTITALAMLLGSPTSYAALYAGNKLLEACEQDDETFGDGVCFGYVFGVFDVMQGVTVCEPEGVTGKQIVSIVRKYLKENPENLHYEAAILVTHALDHYFPCSE
mgnify:CR=1 FL=1